MVRKVVIDKRDKKRNTPFRRIFNIRGAGFYFKEYFPNGYTSDIFPKVFIGNGLFMVNEKEEALGYKVISFEYELYLANTFASKGNGEMFNYDMFNKLAYCPVGSCVWIKNLIFEDKEGVVHKGEVGEFCIKKTRYPEYK